MNDEYVRDRLAPHRETLEILAEMDTPLSADAQGALKWLDEHPGEDDDA
ncbi:hypothetical protein ACFQE1_04370 [Halobium palmae]|uniref:Uncharacterized protein n=1 Tax=Halobium palmae TaxID=1776492 RepID=A0ABD5RWN0_9EURY